MVRNHYDDVGYHYMIHPSGKVYEGRSIVYKGSHVRNKNTKKIGILFMGDFDHQWWDVDDDLTPDQLTSSKKLIVSLKKHCAISYFGGHKEFLPGSNYNCPGDVLLEKVRTMRREFGFYAP